MALPTCRHKGCENSVREKYDKRDNTMRYTTECNTCESLRLKYKITTPERNHLYEFQEGRCILCSREVEFNQGKGLGKHDAAVDHCHITGDVRGILCGYCNNGLGRFEDRPALLRRAAEYLELYQDDEYWDKRYEKEDLDDRTS